MAKCLGDRKEHRPASTGTYLSDTKCREIHYRFYKKSDKVDIDSLHLF